jgi:DNA-binding response OmpR family regulator
MNAAPHILIAEDDALIAHAIMVVLEAYGYRVTVTHDGQQALTAAESDAPDLLVTDMRMPGMQGRELAQRFRQGRPELPVLVMSGNTARFPDEETFTTLSKPFSMTVLLSTVRSMLPAAL